MARDFEKFFGDIPFGWRRADDGCLVQDEDEVAVIQKIRSCFLAGATVEQVAKIIESIK